MNKRLCLSTLLLLLSYISIAGVIKGRVTDDKDEALPYATIYVQGSTLGTNANSSGQYELSLSPGSYKVLCQYMGFKQQVYNVTIKGEETATHDFKLTSEALEIKEVVVRANSEDPAYSIIREAIKQRGFHLHQVESFQTSIYFKGVAHSRTIPKQVMGKKITAEDMGTDSTGKGVLFLTEEDADYYAENGKNRTVIHSVHTSGDPKGVGFPQFPPVISFYENNVPVMGRSSRGYISPISDNALFYYKYRLEGEFLEQDRMIYKITVMPKRDYEPCFNGTIYIVDNDWAIHSLDMQLTRKNGLDFMDTLKLKQLFIPLHQDEWVIKSQVIYFTVNFLGFDITASGVTVYNNQKINQPIADTMFADRVVSSYDKVANKKDTSYWTTARPIPLESDEKRDFVEKDSLRKIDEDPKRIDSLRRRGNKFKKLGFVLGGYVYNSKEYKNTWSTNSLLLGLATENMLNYNITEGVNFAPKVHLRHMVDTGKNLHVDAAVRYGFSNTHFNAIARLYYINDDRTWTNRRWMYGVEGGKYVFQFNPENPVSQWFNTYSALLYRQNDLRIYERWEGALFVHRNYGNGFRWNVHASYQHRIPLQNTTDYSIFPGTKDGFTAKLPGSLPYTATAWEEHDAMLFRGTVAWQPGYSYIQYPDYKVGIRSRWPVFSLTYFKGLPGLLNSKVNYDKWRFSVRDEVNLRLLGSLSYHFATGGFLNSDYVSIPDLMHLYGNRGVGYAAPYLNSFQFAQYYEFSNKEKLYGEGHVEYHLNGLLSNKLPLLRQARWYLLCGGNAFYAHDNDYYTEAFVGIENIGYKLLRVLRIDFVQSWDSHMGHNSGIRFGFNSKAFTVSSSSPAQGEW